MSLRPLLATPDADAPERHISKALLVWLLAMTVLGGGLRLYQLGQWSFWEDELYTLERAAGRTSWMQWFAYVPTGWVLDAAGADLDQIVPPQDKHNTADGYPPAEDWRAAGINEFNARLLPCLLGIASIPILGCLSVRLLGATGAAILALLLAVSPWHIFWSQASRFYIQVFLFYNVALILYFDATQRRRPALLLAAVGAMLLAFWTHPPSILLGCVLTADYAWGLIRRQPVHLGRVGWITAGVSLVAAGVVIGRVVTSEGFAYWASLNGHDPYLIVLGTLYQNRMPLVVAAVLTAVGLSWHGDRRIGYLIFAAVVPAIALAVLGTLENFYVHTRYAFVVHYAWLALAALGLATLGRAAHARVGLVLAYSPVAILAMAMMMTNLAYFTTGHGFRARWAEAFAYVREHRRPGEQIAPERKLIATYYLETLDLADFPDSPDALRGLDQPTWILTLMDSPSRDMRFPYLHEMAQLKAYYDLRIIQPFSSIRVYYYDPSEAMQNRGGKGAATVTP